MQLLRAADINILMGVVYKATVKIGSACSSVWRKYKPDVTPTPSVTPSIPHETPTPTITPSPTPSITPSKTPSPSPTPSATPVVSPTLSKPKRPKKKSFWEKLLEFLKALFK